MRAPSLAAAAAGSLALFVTCAAAQTAAEDEVLVPQLDLPSAGIAVDVDGARLVVGVGPYEPGTQGAAQFYRRDPSGAWVEDGVAVSSTPHAAQAFGADVAIDGETAVVGVPFDSSPVASGSGSAQVFDRVAGVWVHAATLFAPSPETGAQHGYRVDVDADRVLVGAGEQSGTGAAHVYERVAGVWQHAATLNASDAQSGDGFGREVRLAGDRAFVGAPDEDQFGVNAGAVYVFERQSSGAWIETAKLTPAPGGPSRHFGVALDTDGDRLLVCASGDETPGFMRGAVFVHERQPNGTWNAVDKLLVPPDPELGPSPRVRTVALDGERAVVGCPGEVGGAYLFERRSDGTWWRSLRLEAVQLVPPLIAATGLARAVAAGGGQAFVTAPSSGDHGTFGASGQVFRYDLGALYHGDPTVSLSAGGAHTLSVRAGDGWAGDVFLFVGTASGTTPGTLDPVSGQLVPINIDAYTTFLLNTGGTLTVPFGVLDGEGAAESVVVIAPGTLPSLAGLTLHHVCLVVDTATFTLSLVSNAAAVELAN